jgi:dolichol-phosphate mannosyltransferase
LSETVDYSVVVPFYNEAENLPLLIRELDALLVHLNKTAEIILANDGSTDGFERPAQSPHFPIRWLHLTANSGQSAAMYYGMQAARGDLVILLDADLQNDPFDVPKLVEHLQRDGLDLITGIRISRQDNWQRRWSSTIANTIRRLLLHDRTSDTGCTLKVLKRELAQRLPGWNGMHRFIPALAIAMGYQIGEAPVSHRPRHAGDSKVQGRKRALRVIGDLAGMMWLRTRMFQGRLAPETTEKSHP